VFQRIKIKPERCPQVLFTTRLAKKFEKFVRTACGSGRFKFDCQAFDLQSLIARLKFANQESRLISVNRPLPQAVLT